MRLEPDRIPRLASTHLIGTSPCPQARIPKGKAGGQGMHKFCAIRRKPHHFSIVALIIRSTFPGRLLHESVEISHIYPVNPSVQDTV